MSRLISPIYLTMAFSVGLCIGLAGGVITHRVFTLSSPEPWASRAVSLANLYASHDGQAADSDLIVRLGSETRASFLYAVSGFSSLNRQARKNLVESAKRAIADDRLVSIEVKDSDTKLSIAAIRCLADDLSFGEDGSFVEKCLHDAFMANAERLKNESLIL